MVFAALDVALFYSRARARNCMRAPGYGQGSRFSLLFKIVVKIVVYVLSIYGFHQNGFICMFFLAVSVLSIFFMFISLDSWYFFQPGWFTLC